MHSLRVQARNVAFQSSRFFHLRTPPNLHINYAHRVSRPLITLSTSSSLLLLRRTRLLSTERTGVFYHPTIPPSPLSQDKSAVAISFLSLPPPHANSSTIIGWIPGDDSPGRKERPFTGFVENSQFRQLMHRAIHDGLQKGVDDIQINGALQLQEGWMHIHDDRNIPPAGRIGDPDDIIASVLVRDSKIVPETYQPMPSYRLCTSDGLTKLTPGLAAHLLTFLEEEAKKETSSR